MNIDEVNSRKISNRTSCNISLNLAVINVSDISEMIDNLKLTEKYDTNDIQNIYNELDVKKEGEVIFHDFIKGLIEKSKEDGKYSDFYLSAMNFYFTPSERIIETMKKAINQLEKYSEDKRLLKELNWVIRTLSERDLFDLRLKKEYSEENNEILNFLSEYSKDKFNRQNYFDLELINTLQIKKKKLRDCKFFHNL